MKESQKIIKIIRWFTRILGSLFFIFITLFLIGAGLPKIKISELAPNEIALFIALFIMILGLLVALRWECLGSGLILGGFLLFWLINFAATNKFWLGWVFTIFPIIGGLYLFCCFQNRRK